MMNETVSSLLKSIITAVFWISSFGAVVIPIFYSDKMMKKPRNYIRGRLSRLKQLKFLTFTGWLFIVAVASSIVFGKWMNYLDSKEEEAHYEEMLDLKLKNNWEKDSIYWSFQNKSRDSAINRKNENIEHESRLHHDSTQHAMTFTMIDRFTFGTKTIIAQAQKDAKLLRDTINVLQEKLMPNVTYPMGEKVWSFQSNDTFYVMLMLGNTGNAPARNVSFKVHYMFIPESNDILNVYKKPLVTVDNMDISADATMAIATGSVYMEPFHFNQNMESQYLLVLGSYYTDGGLNRKIELCFSWHQGTQKWLASSRGRKIIDLYRKYENQTSKDKI